jgi:tetratricopeptide (TPR) repeat protein
MLYPILPPILVVLSAIGIIFFLVKKASKVALIEDLKKREHMDLVSSFWEQEKKPSKLGSKLRQVGLFILEKTIGKMKTASLKLGNLFALWGEKLRRKRSNHFFLKRDPQNRDINVNRVDSGIFDRIRQRRVVRNNGLNNDIRINEKPKESNVPSENIVVSIKRPEIKDQFKQILIERIAINPKDLEAYERLGEYYYDIGNYNHAKECFKQVLKLDPRNNNVKFRMKNLERLLVR